MRLNYFLWRYFVPSFSKKFFTVSPPDQLAILHVREMSRHFNNIQTGTDAAMRGQIVLQRSMVFGCGLPAESRI